MHRRLVRGELVSSSVRRSLSHACARAACTMLLAGRGSSAAAPQRKMPASALPLSRALAHTHPLCIRSPRHLHLFLAFCSASGEDVRFAFNTKFTCTIFLVSAASSSSRFALIPLRATLAAHTHVAAARRVRESERGHHGRQSRRSRALCWLYLAHESERSFSLCRLSCCCIDFRRRRSSDRPRCADL